MYSLGHLTQQAAVAHQIVTLWQQHVGMAAVPHWVLQIYHNYN